MFSNNSGCQVIEITAGEPFLWLLASFFKQRLLNSPCCHEALAQHLQHVILQPPCRLMFSVAFLSPLHHVTQEAQT